MNPQILYWASRAVLALPAPLQRLLAGGADVRDGYTFDPGLRLLAALDADRPPPRIEAMLQERAARDALAQVVGGAPAPVPTVRDLDVDGGAGRLRARFYANGPGEPLLVYFHGGGFVFGNLESHDALLRLLCSVGRFSILAVDYRLVPEVRFPAPVEDACAAFRWARKNAGQLGVDGARIGVGGDSAGGNLAAVVSQLERGEPPACQLLIYPATDRSREHASMESMRRGALLSTEMVRWFHAQYASTADPADPRISPLLHHELRGLPPALVVTAGFDPLRDEGEAYVRALSAAGTRAELLRFDALPHGFCNLLGIHPPSRAADITIAHATRNLFG